MSDAYELRRLVESLAEAIQCSTAEKAKREQYEGYEWEWAGGPLIEARDRAISDLGACLDEYIAAKVAEALTADRNAAVKEKK
jgi:hypothetical protein